MITGHQVRGTWRACHCVHRAPLRSPSICWRAPVSQKHSAALLHAGVHAQSAPCTLELPHAAVFGRLVAAARLASFIHPAVQEPVEQRGHCRRLCDQLPAARFFHHTRLQAWPFQQRPPVQKRGLVIPVLSCSSCQAGAHVLLQRCHRRGALAVAACRSRLSAWLQKVATVGQLRCPRPVIAPRWPLTRQSRQHRQTWLRSAHLGLGPAPLQSDPARSALGAAAGATPPPFQLPTRNSSSNHPQGPPRGKLLHHPALPGSRRGHRR